MWLSPVWIENRWVPPLAWLAWPARDAGPPPNGELVAVPPLARLAWLASDASPPPNGELVAGPPKGEKLGAAAAIGLGRTSVGGIIGTSTVIGSECQRFSGKTRGTGCVLPDPTDAVSLGLYTWSAGKAVSISSVRTLLALLAARAAVSAA